MSYLIKIVDGQPFEHPIAESNFRRAFPSIDPNNPGPEFARFIRVPRESFDQYTVILGGPTYEWDGDVVKDVWQTRAMTPEERADIDSYNQLNSME